MPLRHELSRILNATVKSTNVLVIDSAERVEAAELVVVRQLLQSILPAAEPAAEGLWRVIVVTQTQGWVEDEGMMLGARKVQLVELEQISRRRREAGPITFPKVGLAGWP